MPWLHTLRRRHIIVICIFLYGLVVWTFLPALQNGFINYDDDVYVTANAHVQAGLDLNSFIWAFESTDASNWHPLTWLSHMADYQLYGLKPPGHHLTNILLHAANSVLLFLLLRRITGMNWRSLFVAAVFGLHPLRVESVAWVAERKDVLSMLFGLLALLMYAGYVQHSHAGKSSPIKFYGLALLFFLCSLMSKPMLVTLPFVLLLLDYWPLRRILNWNALILEKIPFLLLAAASCAITFVAQKNGGALDLMAGVPFSARIENVPISYCRYLGKLFWPENLAIIYPTVDHWPNLFVFLATALLFGISVLAILKRHVYPFFITGWFWFLGTLIPVIGLVAIGEQAMADRYSYFPTIGVLILIAWGLEAATRGWRHRIFGLSAVSVITIVVCIFITRHNIEYWKSSETLFRHVIACTDDNYSAHCNLGNALMNEGRLDEALREFETATKLKPGSPENHCNLGVTLADLNRVDDAIAEFQNAIKLNPAYGPAHHDLGMALEQKGQLAEATREYELAAKLMPGSAAVHNSLGVAFAKQNRLDDALAQFQEAVSLDATFVPAQNNLKMALDLKGH